MSRLKQLVERLCPDGVEYRPLGKLGTLVKGRGLQKKDFSEEGVGCIHYGQIYTRLGMTARRTLTHVPESKADAFTWVNPGDIVIAITSENVEDVCKSVVWMGKERIVTGAHAAVFHATDCDPMYIAYFLQSEAFQHRKAMIVDGVKVIEMKVDSLCKVPVPVPPLEVQREVVRILDSFQELDDALTAEIEAREKQLLESRVRLFGSLADIDAPKCTMGAISKRVCSGGTPSSKRSDYYGGNIPWLRTQEVDFKDIYSVGVHITEEGLKNSAAKWIPANCIIVAMYGATAGKVGINRIPLTTNQACCNLEIDDNKADLRFAYHWLWMNYEALKGLGEGSQGNISGAKVKAYPIPLPSLNTQRQIASKLDSLLALFNALIDERDARRRQFAHYRDRLLSFPEKEA